MWIIYALEKTIYRLKKTIYGLERLFTTLKRLFMAWGHSVEYLVYFWSHDALLTNQWTRIYECHIKYLYKIYSAHCMVCTYMDTLFHHYYHHSQKKYYTAMNLVYTGRPSDMQIQSPNLSRNEIWSTCIDNIAPNSKFFTSLDLSENFENLSVQTFLTPLARFIVEKEELIFFSFSCITLTWNHIFLRKGYVSYVSRNS